MIRDSSDTGWNSESNLKQIVKQFSSLCIYKLELGMYLSVSYDCV
jgi:hypothetical protein